MAERTLHPTHVLDAPLVIGANTVRQRTDLSVHSFAIPLGGEASFADTLKGLCGLAMPDHTLSTIGRRGRAIRTGPDQIFFLSESGEARDASAALAAHAYMTDQSDGWVALEIDGPETLPALERMCMIDLSQERFPTDASARTVMLHIAVLLVRLDINRFLLLTPRTSARSFIHEISVSYGNVFGPDGP